MKKTFELFLLLFFITVISVFAQDNNFRFAWLSDTHVGSPSGASDLSISMNYINQLSNIDFIILSGDISETGRNIDLVLSKKILDSLKKPYYLIPGNHDTKWSESGGTKFQQLWGNDRFVFKFGEYFFIGLHEGPLMRMADGHFAPEDIRWLDSLLSTVNKNQPIIFVTHYPVDSSIDNWFEVLDRLKKYDTRLILCGHGHSNKALNFEGIPGVMGRSNLRAKSRIGGFNIVELKGDSIFFTEVNPGLGQKIPWNKIKLTKISFSNDTTKYNRPDFSINKKYPKVKARWLAETNFVNASTPVSDGKIILTTNTGGEVIAFSIEGTVLWKFKTNGRIFSTPTISENKIVIASTNKNIFCLDKNDGKILWKILSDSPIVSSPVIEKNNVFMGTSDGKFIAMDLNSGKKIWDFDQVKEFIEAKPLICNAKIIFGAWDTYLYALNKKDGSLAWKWSNGRPEVLYSPAACLPVTSNGKVFIVAPDRFITAIDEQSGKTIWRTNRFQVRESIGISEDGKTIFARTMNDTVIALDPVEKEFKTKWISAAGYGYDFNPSPIIEHSGNIFFGTRDGFVYCLDAINGLVKWIYRIGVTSVNPVLPISENSIVVSDMDGKITMLEW
ncbi:MAG: PQQ-binding-like beta-propeller repeat protein [Ignavibacteriales bacterium]|nr:PQQ-binding-like beta-propeller repeat protein [Ignavibacteriales bacterium]